MDTNLGLWTRILPQTQLKTTTSMESLLMAHVKKLFFPHFFTNIFFISFLFNLFNFLGSNLPDLAHCFFLFFFRIFIWKKWPIPPYIKGLIIYNTPNRSRENLNKKNYRKNTSENNHTLSLNFFRIFS